MLRNLCSLLLSITLLTGCGFQLRGTYLVPEQFKTIHLQTNNPHAKLTYAVQKRFQSGQVQLLPQPQAEVATLVLGRDHLERKSLTLFTDGQVAEYRLFYSVQVSIIPPHGKRQQLTLQAQRDYLDDPGQALAKSRELEMLLQEMRVEIADQLLRKLAAFKESAN